ncbi:MAG: hypothetical protein ACE5FU_10235 [Nitrospinota bacterium]
MSFIKTKAPSQDGSVLIQPDPSQISLALEENKELFSRFSFEVAGLSAQAFREETRKEFFSLAKAYTTQVMPLESPLPSTLHDPEFKIIQTGHQPGFSHPGIMLKYSLLDLLSKKFDGLGVNLAVDHDIAGQIGCSLPSELEPGTTRHENLFSEVESMPLEYITAPAPTEIQRFFSSIEKHLSEPHFRTLLSNFRKWKTLVSKQPKDHLKTATDFLVSARRSFFHEQRNISVDIPVSLLSGSQMFLHFFLHIAKHAELFISVYNSELSKYRKEHKVRYAANPFPDLKSDGELFELPFWFFYRKKRHTLFVKTVKGKTVLFSGGKELTALPTPGNPSSLDPALRKQLRPKAIPLTLFNRLFFSDIFVHGTGGGKYDEITDGVIKSFFKVSPPKYITATLTRFPNVPIESQGNKIEKLESKLRDTRFNPDRYVKNMDEQTKRKQALLEEIKKPGADRKTIGIEIKSINQNLLPLVVPVQQKLLDELSALKEEEKRFTSVQRRDFPYFFFSPEDIMAPLCKLVE